MNANKILTLLQADKFYLVKVRFKHLDVNPRSVKVDRQKDINFSPKTYTYKVPNSIKLVEHDEVVIKSPFNGYVVCLVVDIIEDLGLDQEFAISKGYKWIVQKVDDSAYESQLAKEAEAEDIIQQHLTRKARDKAMESIKEMFSDTAIEQLTKALE